MTVKELEFIAYGCIALLVIGAAVVFYAPFVLAGKQDDWDEEHRGERRS